MRTVDDFAQIRQLHSSGQSGRAIARALGCGRETVRKALSQSEPTPYRRTVPRAAPRFGAFAAIVDAIVQADESAPPKQRHTGQQIFRRLVAEHGYTGSYDPVRRYLFRRRQAARETFIPLDHPPGRRAEADFGHIHVDFPDGRRLVPVLIVTWSYSNAPFAVALPTERAEAVLQGLCEAFAFFGCVPRELWWDNPTTVAIHIHRGRERTLHSRYAALVSHYALTAKFCLPATPQEKPRVENRVKDLERQWATPVPQVADLAELNRHLRQCCVTARDRCSGSNTETVGRRFEQDRLAALALPERPFDPCVIEAGTADKYQTVAFDGNRYSVPRRWAFRSVTVKGYVDRVAIVAEGSTVIATHPRSYGKKERIVDPLHFLCVLQRKPAALDHAPVYRDWNLPPSFAALRRDLEARLGPRTGARQYIRVLQLLAHHPVERIERALANTLPPTAAAIEAAVERLARYDESVTLPADLPAVTVPPPDLARYNRFLSGVDDHGRCERPLAADQPPAVTTADHACGA